MIVKILKPIEIEGRKFKKDQVVDMFLTYARDFIKQKKVVELDDKGNEVVTNKNK